MTFHFFQKSINIAKSEMYKKMRKRLAIQTSCMKELGRVQVHKLAVDSLIIPLITERHNFNPLL